MSIKQVFSTLNAQEKTHTGRFKCCPICGTQQLLKKKGGNHRPACPNCEFVQFRNPVPGVVVVIEKDGYVLLGSITVGGAVTYPTDCNKPQPTIDLVWKVVAIGMAIPSIILVALDGGSLETSVTLLAIGLLSLALAYLSESE